MDAREGGDESPPQGPFWTVSLLFCSFLTPPCGSGGGAAFGGSLFRGLGPCALRVLWGPGESALSPGDLG